MENVFPRPPSGIFYVKKDIPADVRHAFGGKSAIWKSLGTKHKAEARAKAPDILDKIEDEIAAARAPVSASIRSDAEMPREGGISPAKPILRREQLLDAIEAWRADTISEAHVALFNGEAETFADFGLEDMAHSERLYRLQQGKWSEIEEFDERLIDALASRGVAMLADHPALGRIRSDFGDAWHDVESFVRQFRRGKFEGWPEDADDTPAATVHAPTRAAANPAAPTAKMPLGELVDRYITRMNPPDATAVRGYVRRLSEALGKPCVQDVTPAQMDDFAVDLQRFPIIKRPDINAKTFRQILELEARSPSPRRLSKKTRWKWFLAYKKLFDYAVSIGLVATNPVEKVMPKAKGEEEERLFYDADDISLIFSRPLFQGCDRTPLGQGERS